MTDNAILNEIGRDEFAAMLDRNGHPVAADKVWNGEDYREATAYLAGREPRYQDGEGLWLQDYIDRLHALRGVK